MTKTESKIRSLCKLYEVTGRVAQVYPRTKTVSLNGCSMSYKDAAKRIRELLTS